MIGGQWIVGNALAAVVLALLAFIVSRATKRPAVAHVLWLLVLVKLVTPPIVPAGILPASRREAAPLATTDQPARSAPAAGLVERTSTTGPVDASTPGSSPSSTTAGPDSPRADAAVGARTPVDVTREVTIQSDVLLGAVWAAVTVGILALGIARTWRFARRLRGAPLANARVAHLADELAGRLGITRRPRIVIVPARIPPLLLSAFGPPLVLLPRELEQDLGDDELRAVLAHELAHFARRDHWVRWIELVVVAIWWWFPLTWWARRELRAAEEECCDAWAKWVLAGDGQPCAHALLKTMDWLAAGLSYAPAAACGIGSFRSLKRRLTMILQVETRRSLSFPARVALGAFALLALTFVPIRAQGGPAPQDAGPKPGAIARIPFARALDAIGVPAVSSTRVFTTETVAEVEGIVATPNDLLRIMAAREGRTIATLQVTQAIAQMELDAAAMTVTDDEVNAEIDRMAGASRSAGALSRDELRPSARTAAAFRKLSSGSKPKPPTGDAKANDMMLQLFIRQRMESYAIRYRGDAGVTLPGDVWAEITAKNGTVRMIRSDDIVESLVALVRGPSLARAQEQLIDGYLLGFTLVAAGKTVTEADVLAYTQRMTEQYQPPFDWKMICQFRGTTIGGEQMRFRLIEAMKRGTGFTANDKTIGDFFNEHRDAFGGACRSVSQVLFRTSDPRTGEPTGDPAEKLRLATLAVEKIREGADFAMIARQFSEDENTASAGGSLAQPIKEFGGGVEPEFLAAVLAMKEPGEVVGPIKTSAGYHVIRLDKLTPPRPVDPTAPTFRNWILDELMNEQMRGTLGLLRLASKITVPPLTRLR